MIPNCATAFVPLQDAIHHHVYPAVIGGPVSEFEVWLFDLHTCSCWCSGNIRSCKVCICDIFIFFMNFCCSAISGQAMFSTTAHLDVLDAVHRKASAAIGKHIYPVCFISFVILSILVHMSCH